MSIRGECAAQELAALTLILQATEQQDEAAFDEAAAAVGEAEAAVMAALSPFTE